MPEHEQHAAVIMLIDQFPEALRSVLTRLGTPPRPNARIFPLSTNLSVVKDPLDPTLEGIRRFGDNAAVFAVEEEWDECVIFEHQRKFDIEKIYRLLQYLAQKLERANLPRSQKKGSSAESVGELRLGQCAKLMI